MPLLTRWSAALAVASLALLAPGCNKGPAEEALAAADETLAAARPEIEKYAPDEIAPLTDALRSARGAFEEGRYTDALRVAQELPTRIEAATAAAQVRKDALAVEWKEIAGRVPARVESIRSRLGALEAAGALPRGLTAETLAAARTDLASVVRAWDEATAAFEGGDVPRALKTARDVEAKAAALAGMLGSPGPPGLDSEERP